MGSVFRHEIKASADRRKEENQTDEKMHGRRVKKKRIRLISDVGLKSGESRPYLTMKKHRGDMDQRSVPTDQRTVHWYLRRIYGNVKRRKGTIGRGQDEDV